MHRTPSFPTASPPPRPRTLLVVAAVIVAVACTSPAAAAEPAWKAAAAKAVITPTEPMYLAGFAGREVPAEGTALDLFAKALAIEDDRGTRCVFVTLDLVEVPVQLREDVAAALARDFSLPNEALLMNCSHTHCGPELKYAEIEFQGLTDPLRRERCLRYNKVLTDKIVGVASEAIRGLAPATISYGHARCGFAMNRRLKSDKPFGEPYLNSPNPDGVVDHDVPVLTVTRADGTLSAVMFGYACHNTSLALKQWHGDYAGHAQQMIEEAHPGTVALFMMGCGGDQNAYPRSQPVFSSRHGLSLATAVEAALDAKPKPIRGPLRLDLQTTRLDYSSMPTAEQLERSLENSKGYERRWDERRLEALRAGTLRDHYDFPIQVVRFGDDLTLVGLAGETCVDYSLRLKREFPGPGRLWVAGYCNDVLAYIPSRRVLLEGGYEAFTSIVYWSNPLHPDKFADSLEERIVDAVHAMWKR